MTPGSELLLLGESGCGKSLLLQALRTAGMTPRTVWHEVQRGRGSDVYVEEQGGGKIYAARNCVSLVHVEVAFHLASDDRVLVLSVGRSGCASMEGPSLLRFLRADDTPAWPDRAAGAILGLFPELRR